MKGEGEALVLGKKEQAKVAARADAIRQYYAALRQRGVDEKTALQAATSILTEVEQRAFREFMREERRRISGEAEGEEASE
jgi:hypothetical protein